MKETQKITNAMYLIASTKLRKARNDLDNTRPYFYELRSEIKRRSSAPSTMWTVPTFIPRTMTRRTTLAAPTGAW